MNHERQNQLFASTIVGGQEAPGVAVSQRPVLFLLFHLFYCQPH